MPTPEEDSDSIETVDKQGQESVTFENTESKLLISSRVELEPPLRNKNKLLDEVTAIIGDGESTLTLNE